MAVESAAIFLSDTNMMSMWKQLQSPRNFYFHFIISLSSLRMVHAAMLHPHTLLQRLKENIMEIDFIAKILLFRYLFLCFNHSDGLMCDKQYFKLFSSSTLSFLGRSSHHPCSKMKLADFQSTELYLPQNCYATYVATQSIFIKLEFLSI